MALFLIECKEDERQDNFLLFVKESSPLISEMTASFADGTILMEI